MLDYEQVFGCSIISELTEKIKIDNHQRCKNGFVAGYHLEFWLSLSNTVLIQGAVLHRVKLFEREVGGCPR